jgi:hypothetical protein
MTESVRIPLNTAILGIHDFKLESPARVLGLRQFAFDTFHLSL